MGETIQRRCKEGETQWTIHVNFNGIAMQVLNQEEIERDACFWAPGRMDKGIGEGNRIG